MLYNMPSNDKSWTTFGVLVVIHVVNTRVLKVKSPGFIVGYKA